MTQLDNQREELLVRAARSEDRAAIAGFQLAMASETEDLTLDAAVVDRGVAAVFDHDSLGRYFVAEKDGVIVACLMITYEWSDWRNGTVWWIQSVYVVPPARRLGVYASLYAHVRGVVEQSPGLRGIRLYVDRKNERAQKVYSRLGMNGDHYQLFEWMKDF